MDVSYKTVFVYGNDGITVLVPSCPGCVTCGNSDSQAKDMARDAIKNWCEAHLFDNRDVPETNIPKDFTMLQLNDWIRKNKVKWGKSKWTVKLIKAHLEKY